MSNPETPSSKPVPSDPGILDYAAEMGKGFVQGAAEGYVNNLKMAADVAKAVPRAVGALKDDLITNNVAAVANAAFGPGTLSTVSAEDREASMPSALQYSTPAGPVAEGILEFTAGYGLLGAGFTPSRGAGALRQLSTMAGQGAATSFALANQENENLSNLLVRLGGPANNYFTRALSTNADDSILKRKLKASLEGVVMDGALGTIETLVKLTKGLQKAASAEESAALLAKIQAQKDKLAAEAQALQAPKASTMPQDASVPSGASESASNAGTAVVPSNGVVGDAANAAPIAAVKVYRGDMAPLEGGKHLSGVQSIDNIIRPGQDTPPTAPFKFYTTDPEDAARYASTDSRTVARYDKRNPGKGAESFEILHGHKPRADGTVAEFEIAPKKTLDLTKSGPKQTFVEFTEAINNAMGFPPLPPNWRRNDLPKEVSAVLDGPLRGPMSVSGGDVDPPMPVWRVLRNEAGTHDVWKSKRPKGEAEAIPPEKLSGSAMADWMESMGFDSVAYMHDTPNGPVKHIVMIERPPAASAPTPPPAVSTVQALMSEGAIPSDAIALATLEHTNLRTLGGTPSIDELHKAIDSTTNQAASVVAGINQSNDQTWKDVVELIDDPTQLKFLQDNWASVGEKLPALVARANAKVVANGLLATRMAGKGDMKMSAEFLNGMIDATVERKALNRVVGRALQINDVEHLTKESEALDEVFRRLGVERDRITSTKAAGQADPAAEKVAKAAQEAGTTFHPVLQRAMDMVESAESAKAALLAEVKGTPTTAQATQLRQLEEILAEAKAHLDVVKASPEVLKAQAKYAEAVFRAGLGPSEAAQAVENFWGIAGKVGKAALEVWQNGLLSSVKTINHNPLSTGLNMLVLRPLKEALGAINEGDPQQLKLVSNHFRNLLETSFESLKLNSRAVQNATRAWKKERPILSQHSLGEHEPVLPGILGKLARGPSIVLNTSDEWFKNVSYQAWVKTQANADARLLGISGDKAEEFQKYYLKVAYGIDGTASKTADGKTFLFQGGVDEAAAATWTSDLLNGSLARSLEKTREKAPVLRLFVPFLRTPSNLLTDGANMTLGFNYLRPSEAGKQFRARLSSPDPLTRAHAKGELVMSTMLALPAVSLYASGNLTGSGPTEPQTRKALMDTGWVPNSLIINGRVYPLNRYSPISRPLMAIADMMETLDVATDENERGTIAEKMLLVFQSQLSNDTFLTGLSNLFSLLEGSPGQVEKALNSYAGSIVPGIVRDVAVAFDGQKRETDGMLGAIRNRVPGWSEFSDPARDIFGRVTTGMRGAAPWNLITGHNRVADVVSPFQSGPISQTPVMKELVATGTVLTPPEEMYGPGINLRSYRDKSGQTYLDYWRETLGRVQLPMPDGSKALVDEALEKLINTPQYKSTALPYKGGDSYNYRVQALRSIYEKYKLTALAMTEEHFRTTTGQSVMPDAAKLKAASSGLNIDALLESGLTSSEEVNKLLKNSGR
jgi:hypothetical protein